jgi:hypothetical protein
MAECVNRSWNLPEWHGDGTNPLLERRRGREEQQRKQMDARPRDQSIAVVVRTFVVVDIYKILRTRSAPLMRR